MDLGPGMDMDVMRGLEGGGCAMELLGSKWPLSLSLSFTQTAQRSLDLGEVF
jgi:hypothetical protein